MTAAAEERTVEMAPDSLVLQLKITCDEELLTYCAARWEREFGDG